MTACVQRGIDSGELRADTDAAALAIALDAFLLGVSVLVRDGVNGAQIDTAIAHVMAVWDAAKSVTD